MRRVAGGVREARRSDDAQRLVLTLFRPRGCSISPQIRANRREMASDDPEVVITEEQAGAVNHRVVKRGGRVLRGFDAELAQKHIDEWDSELEQKALDWIFAMTGERVAKIADLRSGIVLCQLINRVRPGLIPRFNQGAAITPLHQRVRGSSACASIVLMSVVG